MKLALLLAFTLASFAHAQEVATHAFELTLEWAGDKIEVAKTERVEHAMSPQNGFPQLTDSFYQLLDGNGDVHYSGPVEDPRGLYVERVPDVVKSTILVPDLPGARQVVIYRRPAPDADLEEAVKHSLP